MSSPRPREFTLDDAMALGRRETALGRHERAAELYRQVVALRPDHIPALVERARALQRIGRFPQALATLQRALAVQPAAPRLLLTLGNALRRREEEALTAYRRAVALAPHREEMHVGLGLMLMQQGRWAEGFAHYEERKARREFLAWIARTGMPVWDGGPVEGRRILLLAEQGVGDTLQFVRYAALLARQGAIVSVQAQPTLQRLLHRADGVSEVVVDKVGRFDAAELLMSLPARFATGPETVPAPVPYLSAPPPGRIVLADRGRPRVGLVWAGNPRHSRDHWRSVPFADFTRLLEVDGIDWIALQKGAAGEDPRMAPVGPKLDDFADTAAVIGQLDLVVTVDTSVAHLAGALGKPVWILLAAEADWRWLTVGEDTPWYPTARLFRQDRLGEWGPVLDRVAAALAGWRG